MKIPFGGGLNPTVPSIGVIDSLYGDGQNYSCSIVVGVCSYFTIVPLKIKFDL